jgi:hypothetical protein
MEEKYAQAADATNENTPMPERNWRTMGIVELACENQSVSDYIEHWEGRALKAESIQVILLEALQELNGCTGTLVPTNEEVYALSRARQKAEAAIRKAKGE